MKSASKPNWRQGKICDAKSISYPVNYKNVAFRSTAIEMASELQGPVGGF